MSWFGRWFGGGGGGLTINDGVYVELEEMDVQVFIESTDIDVSLADNHPSLYAGFDYL